MPKNQILEKKNIKTVSKLFIPVKKQVFEEIERRVQFLFVEIAKKYDEDETAY